MWSPVRNIPTFKDSCDVMGLLLSRKMVDRLPKRPQFTVSRLSGMFGRLFMRAYTTYSSVLCIRSHIIIIMIIIIIIIIIIIQEFI